MATSEVAASLDYTNRGGTLVGVCIIAIVVTSIVVPLRFYVRVAMVKSVGWDDWMALVAAASGLFLHAVTIVGVKYGIGRHTSVVANQDSVLAMKCYFLGQLGLVYTLLFIKLSICLFIVRLCPRAIYRKICYGIGTFLSIYTFACGFTIIFQCTPIRRTWDRMETEGTCFSRAALVGLSSAHASINVLTDFFLVLLPVPIIWNVQVPIRQKISLTIILALGVFAGIAGSIRFSYTKSYGSTGDYLWDTVDLITWSVVEIMLGTFCSCVPALKPLFKRYLRVVSTNDYDLNRGKGSSLSGKIPGVPHASKTTVYAGTRGQAKEAHESEETIFPKGDLELGIRVTQEVRITDNRSMCSAEEDTTNFKGQV